RSHRAACHQGPTAAAESWAGLLDDRGHWCFSPAAGGETDRRIVEPQYEHIALDAAGRQPIAWPCTRPNGDLERAVGAADQLLAGEALALHCVGDEPSFEVVKRDGEIARLRRNSFERDVAATVQRLTRIIAARIEGDTVARSDRQFAAARHHGAGVRIDAGRSDTRPCGPRPDADAAIGGALGNGNPCRAKPNAGRDDQSEQCAKQQSHGLFRRCAPASWHLSTSLAYVPAKWTPVRRQRTCATQRILSRRNSSSYTSCGKLGIRGRPSGPFIATRRASRWPLGRDQGVGPCRLYGVGPLVAGGERTRGVVHQPLDSHQNFGAA